MPEENLENYVSLQIETIKQQSERINELSRSLEEIKKKGLDMKNQFDGPMSGFNERSKLNGNSVPINNPQKNEEEEGIICCSIS